MAWMCRHREGLHVKPSVLYFAFTAVLLTLAITLAADTPDRWIIGTDVLEESHSPLSRDQAIEIARNYLAVDEGDIDGRLLVDPKQTPDGGWNVAARWSVDSEMRSGIIVVDRLVHVVGCTR